MPFIHRFNDSSLPFRNVSYTEFERFIYGDRYCNRDDKITELLAQDKIGNTYIFEIDDNGYIYIPLSDEEFLFVYAFSVELAFEKIYHLYDEYPFLKYIQDRTPKCGNRYHNL